MKKTIFLLAAGLSMAASGLCAKSLTIGNGLYALTVGDSQGFAITRGDSAVARNDRPAKIAYFNAIDSTVTNHAFAYQSVTGTADGGILASCHAPMPDGAVFTVEDRYSSPEPDVFVVDRHVKVAKADRQQKANGFRSSYTATVKHSAQTAPELFVPSIIYRDTTYTRPGAIGTRAEGGKMLVKETRTGTPLIMLNDAAGGNTLTMLHLNPIIDVGENAGGGRPGEINSGLKYGSIGYSADGRQYSLTYTYPCLETPVTYEPGMRRYPVENSRFHEVSAQTEQHYRIALLPYKSADYNEAMLSAYQKSYLLEAPEIRTVDPDTIYMQNMRLLNAEWRSMGKGDIKAAGLPWSLDLPDGKNTEGVSFQMGFVGQQIAVGYHLMRYGIEHNDPPISKKGTDIIDFWTSESINSSYFPTVWWDPADNETCGQRRDYPTFLRCLTDGMESLIDACEYAAASGHDCGKWEATLDSVMSRLVSRQNPDGSFFRAYRTDGSVETGGDRNTFGASKMNTHIPVRLLARMHKHTSDPKYREAALKAARYAYDNFYAGIGKYVGGTPDNPNTVDKEAAIYALYCFNAAHDLTGDPKYLAAAEHAAINAMSWTYTYDFRIPHRNDSDRLKNPFADGGVLGFSVIATGHSGADNFIAYMCHEMLRLHKKTGSRAYADMASFLLHNTKLNTDFDGRMGYKYRAFMPEATNVADLAFRSVSRITVRDDVLISHSG